jgi:hypothetical protein
MCRRTCGRRTSCRRRSSRTLLCEPSPRTAPLRLCTRPCSTRKLMLWIPNFLVFRIGIRNVSPYSWAPRQYNQGCIWESLCIMFGSESVLLGLGLRSTLPIRVGGRTAIRASSSQEGPQEPGGAWGTDSQQISQQFNIPEVYPSVLRYLHIPALQCWSIGGPLSHPD